MVILISFIQLEQKKVKKFLNADVQKVQFIHLRYNTKLKFPSGRYSKSLIPSGFAHFILWLQVIGMT